MTDPTPADEYQLIVQTSSMLRKRGTREPEKAMQVYLRGCAELFRAEAACIVSAEVGRPTRVEYSIPQETAWDLSLLDDLARGTAEEIPAGILAARLRRRGRTWGAIALRRDGSDFDVAERRALSRIAAEIDYFVGTLDDASLAEVRARIDMKILRDLPPKDLYYQILDGLHRLTRYDHSASLFLYDSPSGRLELVAEQIAWRKMRSERIGEIRTLPDELQGLIREDVVLGFHRTENRWAEWTRSGGDGLAAVLDPNVPSRNGSDRAGAVNPEEPEPPLQAMLVAAIGSTRDGFGLLRLGAQRPNAFGDHELGIVRSFVPAVSVALRRAQTSEEVQRKVLDVERRATLAHLARGVAHDVNNAFGSILPLVQQMRVEEEEGRLDPVRLRQDLAQIESSLDVARRIFTGMLRLAKGSVSPGATCEPGRAIASACGALGGLMSRAGVLLECELPENLPPVVGKQYELEQLFLSLATNAIEAMPTGGALRITGRVDGERVWIVVADTGHGIPPDLLPEIEKPFVST
ncbi:MAG TPA: ATP-binding protein, partial [Candidatus Eisenbacteria bacterium]|nr:ATP-binding protein [Candidatus Eisenbacteria bacterium]